MGQGTATGVQDVVTLDKPNKKAFVLWKPTLWDYICKFIVSESFAWAVQNAVGVLFTVLFTVVWRMTFTLACVSSALYGAGAQILSLDRTVGGRLFGGTIFVGCMLSGGIIGGAISSLAWVAHGSSKGLFHYFEDGLESPLLQNLTIVQDFEEEELRTILGQGISFVESTTTQTVARELPEFLDNFNEDIFNALGSLFPAINSAYWVLLIVLFAIVSLPFAVARAHKNLKVGILMAIATLFMGSQVVFATLTPILGIREYWTQIVTGYIKVALVNCGAMCCTALLFFVKSSHDSVRTQMGQVLKDTGSLLSRIASNVNKQQHDNKAGKRFVTEDQNQNLYDVVMEEVKAMAEDSVLAGEGKQKYTKKLDEEQNGLAVPMPCVYSGFEIRGMCQAIEDSLAICLFETPLPEITSHVGARRSDFVGVLESLRAMLSTICCIETIHVKASQELVSEKDVAPLTIVMAELSAILLKMSHVLSDMDLWKPCKGEKVSWKPQGGEFWNTMEQNLINFSDKAIDTINSQGSNKSTSSQNDTMLLVLNCYSLIQDIRGCEFQLCKALDIDVHADKLEDESNAEAPGLKDKIFSNAYLPSIIIHGLLLSGAAVYGLVIMSSIKLVKGSKLVLTSAKDRSALLRDRHVQFAFKYWLGLSLTIMSIVLILWKEKFSSENQLKNAYDITYFFFVWQPIYFWITAAICIQFQVEAAAFRAVLRTTMTAVGGTLGWFTMMNGRLANNAVFIGGITAVFNGFCALASPIKEFRYSLFLTTFTFNAVVVCQYFGCCDVAGETNIYGGKVLSTLLGSVYSILVSWCILPYYTSTKMLDIEHEVLKDGLSLLKQLHQKNEQEVVQKGSTEVHSQCESEPSLENVRDTVDTPLTEVHKELELNVVDKRQLLLLTWTLLPTPKIVPLLEVRLEAMGVFLREAIKLKSTPLWSSGQDKDKVNGLLSEIKEDVEEALEASDIVVGECKVVMDATSRKALNDARVNLASKVKTLGKARAKLRDSFIHWDERHREEKWSDIELKLLARSQLLIHTLREINVIGLLLSETEATLDRDRWLSWAASWFGRRPF